MLRKFVGGSLAILAGGAFWYLYPQAPAPQTIPSPKNIAFLIAVGITDTAPTRWNGSITATGTTIQSLRGWRFAGMDSVTGVKSWTLSTHQTWAVGVTGPMEENGVIVVASDDAGNPRFA